MQMKVLFIGGTGLISSAVSRLVVERGFELFLLNRGTKSEFLPVGAKEIRGDIHQKESVKEILSQYKFDVVVDWIAFTKEDVQRDLELFSNKVKQYIFISSASAYQKPLNHYKITESTPLMNPYWEYSRNKIACEELLQNAYRNTGFPMTIVRPSFTYGDQKIPYAMSSWQYPWSLIDRMKQGKKVIVIGDGTSLWTMTHNTDFAKGFIGLLGNSQAIGEAFHITSDEVLTWEQILRCIGDAIDVQPNIVHISSEFISEIVPDLTGDLQGDKAWSVVFDNSKIKNLVPDYVATKPFREGIRDSIKWFENHEEACGIDEQWNKDMDKIIRAYEYGLKIGKE